MVKMIIIDTHLKPEYIQKYGNGKVFIETGTYRGDTVNLALDEEFDDIYSIELNDDLYESASKLFQNEPRVKLYHGDSVDCLIDILNEVTGPATFWLDAHASGPLPGGRTGGSPLLDELKLIKDHVCKDDCRLFGSDEWSHLKKEDVLKVLNEINKNYKIIYLDGQVKDDVLCATVNDRT